jgi:hypothetical protein
MLYAIPDTLLKVSLNTNKTGHHVLRCTWHIIESDVKHLAIFIGINATVNNISAIMYNMAHSFVGV